MDKWGALTPRLDVQTISDVYYIPMIGDFDKPQGSVACPFNKADLVSTAASGVPGRLDMQPGYTPLNGRLAWDAPDGNGRPPCRSAT